MVMVYIYIVNGVFKSTYKWGAPTCDFFWGSPQNLGKRSQILLVQNCLSRHRFFNSPKSKPMDYRSGFPASNHVSVYFENCVFCFVCVCLSFTRNLLQIYLEVSGNMATPTIAFPIDKNQ